MDGVTFEVRTLVDKGGKASVTEVPQALLASPYSNPAETSRNPSVSYRSKEDSNREPLSDAMRL